MAQPDSAVWNKLAPLVQARKDALSIRWNAATALIAAYAVLLSVLDRPRLDEIPLLPTVAAWLLSAALGGLSLLLPKRALADKRLRGHLQIVVDPKLSATRMRLDPKHSRLFQELPAREQRMLALTQLFERPYTQALLLSGAVGLVGLAYGVAFRTLLEAVPLLVVALALNCWHYPRLTRLIDRGHKLARADEQAAQKRAVVDALAAREAQRAEPPPPARRSSRPPPPAKR
jgi:hypothetical protein